MANAEAWFNNSLRPRKPEGSLGRTAQDSHLDSHTAPELCLFNFFFHVALRPEKSYGLLGMWTNWDREWEPRPTSLFTQLLGSDRVFNLFFFMSCCFTSTEATYGLACSTSPHDFLKQLLSLVITDRKWRKLIWSSGKCSMSQRGWHIIRARELCESRGGRPGLPSLINLGFLWT